MVDDLEGWLFGDLMNIAPAASPPSTLGTGGLLSSYRHRVFLDVEVVVLMSFMSKVHDGNQNSLRKKKY